MRLAGLLLLASLAPLTPGCSSLEDKRVFQILNRSGFGHHYQGDATEENYAAVGDQVLVTDPLNAEFLTSPPQPVDIDGTIEMPEIGSVHVAGLTEGEIAALLTGLYRPYFDDMRISVRIKTQSKWFFVFGEVAKEGRQPLAAVGSGDVTVLEAAMLAGPNKVTSNLSRVKLVRGDPVDPLIVVVDLERLLRTGDTTYNIRIRENDIIVVPPTLIGALGNALTQLVYPVTQVVGALVGVLSAVTYYQTYLINRTFF